MAVMKDLTGLRFGRLVVVSTAGKTKSGNYTWSCACDCGGIKTVSSSGLRHGGTQSCGCIKREQNATMFTTHGESGQKTRTRLYRIWSGMKNRCLNPNNQKYHAYGARGITVCDEWLESFSNFKSWAISVGYTESCSIDRIEVDGNYEPNNCRWVKEKAQQNNRRNNRLITFNEETRTLAQWCEITGLSKSTIEHRLARGWSVEDTLTKPCREVAA